MFCSDWEAFNFLTYIFFRFQRLIYSCHVLCHQIVYWDVVASILLSYMAQDTWLGHLLLVVTVLLTTPGNCQFWCDKHGAGSSSV